MIYLNRTASNYLTVPRGYPFDLSAQVGTTCEAFIPEGVDEINIRALCVGGSCSMHAAIYTRPTNYPSNTGNKPSAGALISQADIAPLTGTDTTLTLTIADNTVGYLFRLWIDDISKNPTGEDTRFYDTQSRYVYATIGAITLDLASDWDYSSTTEAGSLGGEPDLTDY